jgi:ABC-2 type transport system permease protein
MIGALHAEWTKLRTLASTGWLLLAAVLLAVGGSAAIIAATHIATGGGDGNSVDPTKLSLTGVDAGQAALVVLAVLAISEEYGTGMIQATLSATPRRLQMLFAKGSNVVGMTLVAALLAVACCLIAGSALLPAVGLTPAHGYALITISHSASLRAAGGTVLYLGLVALLSLGIGTAIRDTGVAIGATLGLLYLPPILALAFTGVVQERIEQIAPMSAGLAIQATTNISALPISPWFGLLVLTGWSIASLFAGAVLLRLRDA